MRLVYAGGPWYWVHVAYSYFLILIGTATLVRGLRRFPPPYRRQTALIITGAIVPWTGNLLYISPARCRSAALTSRRLRLPSPARA